jgi:tetratricopeptide (TPR) repeat protein
MKAEERHQLKENDLASWMQYGFPVWLKQNGSYILLVLALCFLGYQLYSMYERKQSNAQHAAWADLLSAGSAENPAAKLQSVIDSYDFNDVKVLAYYQLALYYQQLPLSPEQMQTFKVGKTEALEKAADAFQKMADLAGSDTLLLGKAYLGLAAVEEDRGNWDAARKRYEQMTDPKGVFANTPFADIAADRLATIGQREKAPRLASMMPPPATRPAVNEPNLASPLGPFLPEAAPLPTPTTSPAFNGSALPDFSPPPMVPSTQPK